MCNQPSHGVRLWGADPAPPGLPASEDSGSACGIHRHPPPALVAAERAQALGASHGDHLGGNVVAPDPFWE